MSPDGSQAQARGPQDLDSIGAYATRLWMEGQSDEAITLLLDALAMAPREPNLLRHLGLAHVAAGDAGRAVAAFEKAVAGPGGDAAACHLAVAYACCGEKTQAETWLRRAADGDPGVPETLRTWGKVLQRIGRFEEATVCFQSAIALRPRWTAPYLDLVSAKRVDEAGRAWIDAIVALLGDPGLTAIDRANLHFAAGKCFDDLAAYEEAIRHFDAANRCKRPEPPFDRTNHGRTIDWIIATFDEARCRNNVAAGSGDETPILIFGMPRSGTTLIEDILARHPEVGAGGEQTIWARTAAALGPGAGRPIPKPAALAIANEHCRLLAAIAPNKRRVTDKMPSNYLRLGLIQNIFPRARLIHCRRAPIDTALSIYFSQFDEGHEYAYDRGDIAFTFEHYARLMTHWRRVLPADRFFEVDYEDLIGNPETTTRRLVAFCGLPWDAACLSRDFSARPVNTASLWQVRQPLYSRSIGRWRHYAPWLGELSRLL